MMWRQSEPLYLTGCISVGPVGDPIRAAASWQRRLGVLAQPGNTVHTQAPYVENWAIDNGAFGVARQFYLGKRTEPWHDGDTEKYLRYLARIASEVDISGCLFATAPDALTFIDNPNPVLAAQKKRPLPVGDAVATWERSRHIFGAIRDLGFPAALVAQDGITTGQPFGGDWSLFDVLFLGGSDTFKLGVEGEAITGNAWRYGKWVHCGRVSSMKRMKYLQSIGCDSADGTYLGFGPDRNLPSVLRWLDATARTPITQPLAA